MNIQKVTPLLQVFDMPRSIAFYCDVLGCEIVSTSSPGEDFYWAMLKLGDAVLMLNTAYEDDERPPAPDIVRTAAHGDTILYFACDSVDEVYAHLRAKNWKAAPPVTTHYGMRQIHTRDPDGYGLWFQHPTDEPAESS
jgi:uncharacterized glyoxalase superfamily protein PhnB